MNECLTRGRRHAERAALQKQSKIEADQSIAEFKASKDAEHKKITASIDTTDFSKVRKRRGRP